MAEPAAAALFRLRSLAARHVAVLTDPERLANPRAVLEAKLPILTQEVRKLGEADACDP